MHYWLSFRIFVFSFIDHSGWDQWATVTNGQQWDQWATLLSQIDAEIGLKWCQWATVRATLLAKSSCVAHWSHPLYCIYLYIRVCMWCVIDKKSFVKQKFLFSKMQNWRKICFWNKSRITRSHLVVTTVRGGVHITPKSTP